MKFSSFGLAWALLGVLLIGVIVLSFGREETNTNPSIASNGPSGLMAFGQLLRRSGYKVSSTPSALPSHRSTDEVLVVPYNTSDQTLIGDPEGGLASELAKFLEKGGRIFLLRMPSDFADSRKEMSDETLIQRISNRKFKVHARKSAWNEYAPPGLPLDSVSATIWSKPEASDEFGGLTKYKGGIAFTIGDGFIAVNRYIDTAQNADVLIQSMRMIAPPETRLVFLENAFNESQPSLIEMLGPGASGAWVQCIVLFVVVVFTLGKRFGVAEEPPPSQVGQRELVDAIADTYRRARATRIACRAAYDRADMEVRKKLKLAKEAPIAERDTRVPPALALEFRRTFEATIDTLPANEAFQRCDALQRQLRAFLERPELASAQAEKHI